MQICLSIGDAYLERIPQYAVAAIKLHLEVLNESVTLSGKWSRKSHRIRFQDVVYVSLPKLDVGIRLSFTLIALLSNEASDYKVIGSGIVFTSEAYHTVQQTVMLSSSNMINLMARLSITTTFSDVQSLGNKIKNSNGTNSVNTSSYRRPLELSERSKVRVASLNTDASADVSHRKMARRRPSKNICQKLGNDPLETSSGGVTGRIGGSGGSRASNNVNMTPSSNISKRDTSFQKESGVTIAQDLSHSSSHADGWASFSRKEKATSSRSAQVYRTVQIQPETLKQNEACERLRMALERKDEKLRKAQQQLDNSISTTASASGLEVRGKAVVRVVDVSERDDALGSKKDEPKIMDSSGRPETADGRSTDWANESTEKLNNGLNDDFTLTQSSKPAVGNSGRDIDSSRLRASNSLNNGMRSSSGTVLRLSGSLNASSAEAHRMAKATLDARESENEERKILDIRRRLLAAEERRLEAQRNQKTRAMMISSQATCKAKAIKEAALISSKAYDKLRNDFDKKEEMLSRVQDELNSSTNTMRRGARYNAVMRSDWSRERRPSSSSQSSTWRVSEQGETSSSRGRGRERERSRASSVPSRTKASFTFQSKALPFSDLRKKSWSSDEGGAAHTAHTEEIQVPQRSRSQSQSSRHVSHVHYIPSAASSRADKNTQEYVKYRSTKHGDSPSSVCTSSSNVNSMHARHDTSYNSVNMSTDRLQQRDNKKNVSGNSQGHDDSLTDMRSALSRKRLAILVHDRVHALKQKIADASPAEGESILRMIRNVLPLEVARSRSDKINMKSSRVAGHAVPSMEEERLSGTKGRDSRMPDNDVRIKSSSTSAIGISHGDMNDSQVSSGGQEGADDDRTGSDDDDDNDDDDDSIETSNLVAQLWDILGVPVPAPAPVPVPALAEQRSPPRMHLHDRIKESTVQGSEASPFKQSRSGGRDYRPLDTAQRAFASQAAPTSSASHGSDGLTGSVSGSHYRDTSRSSPRAEPYKNAAQDVQSPRGKSSTATGPEGSGGRWWRNDYLALKWEIKHIVESASPLRGVRGGTGILFNIDDSASTSMVYRESASREEGKSRLQAPSSSSSSSAHQTLSNVSGQLDSSNTSNQLTNDPTAATPTRRHVAINIQDSYADSATATPSAAYPSAAHLTLLEQFSLPSPQSQSYIKNHTPEQTRSSTIQPAPLTPPYTASHPSLVLAASRSVIASPSHTVFIEDRRGPVWHGDQSEDESMNVAGDASAVDTSACISRQIDDVGRAINTLQARIASYMYISPDASPADGLIRSKIKGAGSRPAEEDTDASTVTVQDATASADQSGNTSTAPVNTVQSPHNDVKFPADADSQVSHHFKEQDTSLPTGTLNDANDVESSSRERVKDSNTHDFNAIRVDGDLDPALLLKENRREEHLEDPSNEGRGVVGTGTATISASGDGVDLKADKMLPLQSTHKSVESPSYSHPAASALIRHSSQNFKLPFPSSGTGTRTGAGVGAGRGVLSSSGNMFHSLMFTGMGGTGTNTEDVSVSVRDMDMGNISYDTMSFAADRMMTLGQSSLLDLNNTEDLLKDIFRDEEKDDDDDDDDDEDGDAAERAVMKWNADPESVLPGLQDDHGSAKKISDTDTDSSTDDFDGIFRLP